MQASESSPNPSQQASNPQQPSEISSEPQKLTQGGNRWLIIGLAAFALFSLGAAGVLAYQNYQLRKQIEIQKPSIAVTPTEALQPTVTPQANATSPTPVIDPIANWNIYINEEYGFSFKYPEKWFILENLNKTRIRIDEKQLTPFEDEMGMGPYYSGYISIEILEQSAPREVQITDPVNTKKCEGVAYCVRKVSDLLVGGKQAAKMEIMVETSKPEAYWYEIQLGNQRIKIVNSTQEKSKLQIIEQILSTFKFTED